MDIVKDSFIIGVRNVPGRWSLKAVVRKLAPIVRVRFTVLNFVTAHDAFGWRKDRSKVAYVRFPRAADREQILMNLQNIRANSRHIMSAFVPDYVPDEVLCSVGRAVAKNLASCCNMVFDPPVKVLSRIIWELQCELQIKCTKLQTLRTDVKYKLWQDIAHIIFKRMTTILRRNKIEPTPHNMSVAYRKEHQHHTDPGFVLSNLRRVEDHFGYPFTQITEEELLEFNIYPCSVHELHEASDKVLGLIQNKVLEHIRQLDTSELPQSTEEQRATIQVRTELKKQEPYLAELIREVVMESVLPASRTGEFVKAKIYGEPCLPDMDTLNPIISHLSIYTRPCKTLFNCMNVKVDSNVYSDFLKIDGTLVGQKKLVCRPVITKTCPVPMAVLEKVKAFYGQSLSGTNSSRSAKRKEVADRAYEDSDHQSHGDAYYESEDSDD